MYIVVMAGPDLVGGAQIQFKQGKDSQPGNIMLLCSVIYQLQGNEFHPFRMDFPVHDTATISCTDYTLRLLFNGFYFSKFSK